MATLSPASAAAIARLRSYVPPPTAWHALPVSRRAAVLILLFPDGYGDLRVVLTMRAATLKSYAGQAALPGGKADNISESPLWCARREAYEEIGLPLPASSPSQPEPASADYKSPQSPAEETKFSPPTPSLPYPFSLEHLCQLPSHLAKTELGVRPCVALLSASAPADKHNRPASVESMLIPRLDAKEVAAVFSAPLHNFLRLDDELPTSVALVDKPHGKWYSGMWTDWHDGRFRMHNFYVPVKNQVVTRPGSKVKVQPAVEQTESLRDAAAREESAPYPPADVRASRLPYRDAPTATEPDPLEGLDRFRVFGMTARMLVDCARVAYGEEPEFEHNSHFGDEAVIAKLHELGRLQAERSSGDEFVAGENDVRAALALGKARETPKKPRGRL